MTPRHVIRRGAAALAAIACLSLVAFGCGGDTASSPSTSSAKIRAAAGSPEQAWSAAVNAVCETARDGDEVLTGLSRIAPPPARKFEHEAFERAAGMYMILRQRAEAAERRALEARDSLIANFTLEKQEEAVRRVKEWNVQAELFANTVDRWERDLKSVNAPACASLPRL